MSTPSNPPPPLEPLEAAKAEENISWASPRLVGFLIERLGEPGVLASIAASMGVQQTPVPEHTNLLLAAARIIGAVRWALATKDAQFLEKLGSTAKTYLSKFNGQRTPAQGGEVRGGDVIEKRTEQLSKLRDRLLLSLEVGRTRQPEREIIGYEVLAGDFVRMATGGTEGDLHTLLARAGIRPPATPEGPMPTEDLEQQKKQLIEAVARTFNQEFHRIDLQRKAGDELPQAIATKESATRLVIAGLKAMGVEGARYLFDFERKQEK